MSNSSPAQNHFSASILVVDDHAAVRAGLRNLIAARPGWFICGEAANGEQAVSLALELKPSAVVMDVTMPVMDGLEATRRIRKQLPGVEVLIVSQHDSQQIVVEAQKAGARGYVVKSHLSADLLPALEAALLHSSRISIPASKAWQDAVSTDRPVPAGSLPDPGPHDDLDLMSGGGNMGELMRAHDWAKTPFGPVSKWPQSLRTALRICLDSRFPIVIWWGRNLDCFTTMPGVLPWAQPNILRHWVRAALMCGPTFGTPLAPCSKASCAPARPLGKMISCCSLIVMAT
jgi:CheY-like chemotaxis protein